MAERWQISADEEREYAAKWVAIKDGKVVFASDDPAAVLKWARTSKSKPDLMIALPEEDAPAISLM